MHNIDQTEIAKFDAVAKNWWDLSGEFKPLHQINPLRVGYILSQSGDLRGKKVLDVGCGGGILSESLARAGALVTAIDMSEVALVTAQNHAQQAGLNIDYQNITAEALAATGAKFDLITCMEMLEHVPEPASIIHSLAQLGRAGADVFVSTINKNAKSFLFAIVGAEYILNLVPRGTHDFKKFIRPEDLCQMLRHEKMCVHNLMGLHYNPITQKYWLAENIDVNYMLYARLP